MSAPQPPSTNRRALAIAVGVVVFVLLVAAAFLGGGGGSPGSPTFPPIGATTRPAGAAAASTQAAIAEALAGVNLQLEVFASPYRPAESARLSTAPRLVVRAVIPDDPDHGLIVIYEFLSTADATSAAQEQAAYVASGVGRVQFTPDTQFTIRVVGSTVVFYDWAAANSPDPAKAQAVSTALETLGFGVPVPG
jgi:hypothetical protein